MLSKVNRDLIIFIFKPKTNENFVNLRKIKQKNVSADKTKSNKKKGKNNLFNLIKQQLIFFKKQFLKFGIGDWAQSPFYIIYY